MNNHDAGRYVIAADLGGTHLRVAVIDQAGTIRSRIKIKTPTDTAEAVVSAMVEASHKCVEAANVQPISAISVVVPSPINAIDGSVVKAPNLPCLDGFALRPALARALQLPVLVENDANAAAVGEMWH